MITNFKSGGGGVWGGAGQGGAWLQSEKAVLLAREVMLEQVRAGLTSGV